MNIDLKGFYKVEYIQNGKKMIENVDNKLISLTIDDKLTIKITTYEEKSILKFILKNAILGFINFIASTGDFFEKNEIKRYTIAINSDSNNIIDDVFYQNINLSLIVLF